MKIQKHTVLCVDDEKNILSSLKRLLRKENYTLLTATSAKEGLEILEKEKVHLVISDQRMPSMNGTEFLAKVKKRYPNILRIILTGYTDVDSITESINKGHIYKFFLKPWNDHTLMLEIRQALEQYDLQQANKLLELSQAMLEVLPSPVIGINRDKKVVVINRAAQTLLNGNQMDESDYSIEDILPEDISKYADEAFSSELDKHTHETELCNDRYIMELIPLQGKFNGTAMAINFQKKS